MAQARAAMDSVSTELGTRFAGLDQTRRIEVLPARAIRIHPAFDRVLVPAATLLMAVVGLVLALVCSNLAIMLLLRGASQHREVSIRMAMGAGRGRILRQFLSESLVLSMAGGAVGCLAAVWLLRVVSATDLPAAAGARDLIGRRHVLAFAIALSILTGVAFGLAPAVRALKTDAANVLAGASALRHHVALRYAMVSFQVALSIVLLTGTRLVIRSTMQMAQVDLGFNSAALARSNDERCASWLSSKRAVLCIPSSNRGLPRSPGSVRCANQPPTSDAVLPIRWLSRNCISPTEPTRQRCRARS